MTEAGPSEAWQRGVSKNYFEVTFERFTEEFNCPPVIGVHVNHNRDVVVFITEQDIPDENLPRWRQFNSYDDAIDLGYDESVTYRREVEWESVSGTNDGPAPRESRGLRSFLTRLSQRTKS